ncbi:MAG TPA: DUF4097 family beta strand repeat-containing protein [Clostridia bacterium]|nr:DUF4097 family beta strand repeat-containing protein [Clostridia bacterium]
MKKLILAILLVVSISSLFAGCSIDLDIPSDHVDGASSGKQDTGNAADKLSADGKGLNKIIITNGVGTINLSKGSGDKVEIGYNKEVKGFGEIDKIMDQILVRTETNGDELTVSVKVKDEESEDFWHWLSAHYKAMNVSVDFDIKVPENIKEFDIADGVGDITLDYIKGKVDIKDGVGDINLTNVSLADECDFTSGTGDISVDGEINELSHLSIKSGVGKTSLKLPGDSKFSLDASTGVGSIDGNLIKNGEGFVGDSLVQDVNGGGPDIEIKSGTGDILIDKN